MVKKLKSEFSFGFELEGILDKDIMSLDNMNDIFNTFLGANGDLHRDGSISYRREVNGVTFEYATPVLQYTPTNVNKAVKFLDNLKNWGVFVNGSCGFHTHISFPEITKVDVFWFIMWLCGTGKYHEFDKLGRTNLFNRRYASPRFLTKVEEAILHGSSIEAYAYIMTNDKYRSIRLHPQGTIEWRGPRTFLNVPSHKKNVAFFKKLDQFISTFVESMNCESFSNPSGKVFYRSDVVEYMKGDAYKHIYFAFKEKLKKKGDLYTTLGRSPEILEKIPYKELDKNKDIILHALISNEAVVNYGKYQSKNLLKFILANTITSEICGNVVINKSRVLARTFNTKFLLDNADKLFENSLLGKTLLNLYSQTFSSNVLIMDKIKEWKETNKYRKSIEFLLDTIVKDTGINSSFSEYILSSDLVDYLSPEVKQEMITSLNNDLCEMLRYNRNCSDINTKTKMLRVYEVFKQKGWLIDKIKDYV